jgi:hypothetical protein
VSSTPRAAALVALLACGAHLGCAGAEWKHKQVASSYPHLRQVHIAVTADAQGEDLREAVEELTTTLRDDLTSRGIVAEVDSPRVPSPLASLRVTEWQPGDQAARYFIGLGAGEGHVLVEVAVTTADGSPLLQGQVRGYVSGGLFGGSSMEAVRAAAHSIAGAIAKRGRADED